MVLFPSYSMRFHEIWNPSRKFSDREGNCILAVQLVFRHDDLEEINYWTCIPIPKVWLFKVNGVPGFWSLLWHWLHVEFIVFLIPSVIVSVDSYWMSLDIEEGYLSIVSQKLLSGSCRCNRQKNLKATRLCMTSNYSWKRKKSLTGERNLPSLSE